jgi:hypothetical protein
MLSTLLLDLNGEHLVPLVWRGRLLFVVLLGLLIWSALKLKGDKEDKQKGIIGLTLALWLLLLGQHWLEAAIGAGT